ncbi:hypothetical protein [[Clostridium] colinum]|uniref:hypothetical protein n=1 Tax=[Clostridium] colinum TaxID=36835 RepID=UPI002023C71C|nr:hypothetical protein [[Clostridium] colinum]
MINFIGKKYSSASTENIINGFNKKRFEDFYNLSPNSLDMVFLGSSHSYCTFDPEIFDNKLGINSFQMGMPLQHPDSAYYTLREILNYQTPKVVVLEIYWDLLQNDFELNQVKTLFQVLNNTDLKNEYIKNDFPLSEKIKYKNNIFKYQEDFFAYKGNEYNKKIKNKFNLKDKDRKKQIGIEEYRSKGYVYCDYKMLNDEYDKTNQFKNLDGKNFNFSQTQKEFLLKIINLCKENNISLVFVTAPIANVSMDYIKNYEFIYNQISDFAKQNNIFYIDYNLINKEKNLLTNDNFRDDAHLNDSGVKIVSNDFIDILLKNDIIP